MVLSIPEQRQPVEDRVVGLVDERDGEEERWRNDEREVFDDDLDGIWMAGFC